MKFRYYGFTDPASGGGTDRFALAIAHVEKDKIVLDLLREVKPPFSPSKVVAEFCDILRRYKCGSVTGDRFASGFASEQFAKGGVSYEVSPRSKSEMFADLLPLINSGRVELLDDETLLNQLQALERRTGRSGRDSIAAPPQGFDDVVNAAAGALTLPAAGWELFFVDPEKPLTPAAEDIFQQEQEQEREERRERAERARDGSSFFDQSLAGMGKNHF